MNHKWLLFALMSGQAGVYLKGMGQSAWRKTQKEQDVTLCSLRHAGSIRLCS